MPEVDGLTATGMIREREKEAGGHLPIIAMTAHAMTGDRERCLAAGMDGYLTKPINPQELWQALEGLLPPALKAEAPSLADPPAASTPPQNHQGLLERFDGDLSLVRQLVGLFLEEYPASLRELERALEAKDLEALAAAAHALKGSVGYFDSPAASAAALRLERVSRGRDLAAAARALEELKLELQRLALSLQTFLKGSAVRAAHLWGQPEALARQAPRKGLSGCSRAGSGWSNCCPRRRSGSAGGRRPAPRPSRIRP